MASSADQGDQAHVVLTEEHLGHIQPRIVLIHGSSRASQLLADPPILVLAGQPGWDSQVERELQAVPHRVRVIRAGYLPLAELSGFLGGADVVAYPSLGEGFPSWRRWRPGRRC